MTVGRAADRRGDGLDLGPAGVAAGGTGVDVEPPLDQAHFSHDATAVLKDGGLALAQGVHDLEALDRDVGAGGESYLASGVTDLYASGTYNTGGNGADGDVDISLLEAAPPPPPPPPPPAAVPEPASWALLLSGIGLAGAALRRRHALKRSNVPV